MYQILLQHHSILIPYTNVVFTFLQLKKRVRLEVERKQHMITALESGVTPDGLKLFQAVKRTWVICYSLLCCVVPCNSFVMFHFRIEDVTWDGKNIRVMDQVTISPPYLPENVQGNMDKAVNHVKKIVSSFVTFLSIIVMRLFFVSSTLFRLRNT